MPSESALNVDVSVLGPDCAVVRVEGELDINTATLLHFQLASQVGMGHRHLVLDLSRMPFMDSTGLTIMIRTMKEAQQVGGSLNLAAPTALVRRVLELTGVHLTVPMHATVEEALRAQAGPVLP
jgi:stage II sporulation protein AA (anti-sigma F factor antagonist)